MLSIRFDPTNSVYVNWPTVPREVLALAERYFARENALDPTERIPSPPLSMIESTKRRLFHAINHAEDYEQARSVASSHYRETMGDIKKDLRRIIATIKLRFIDHLDRAEPWGVYVVEGERGISLQSPNSQAQWLIFLNDYLEYEASLPVAERLNHDLFHHLQGLAADLERHRVARDDAFAARQVAVQDRTELTKELVLLLKTAVLVVSLMRFGGRLRQELEHWGFRVIVPEAMAAEGEGESEGGAGTL